VAGPCRVKMRVYVLQSRKLRKVFADLVPPVAILSLQNAALRQLALMVIGRRRGLRRSEPMVVFQSAKLE